MEFFSLAKYLLHASQNSLTCRNILRHGADGFTSPPKEGEIQIFIALTNSFPSAGFEPANLGPNSKHVNHYIAGDDVLVVTSGVTYIVVSAIMGDCRSGTDACVSAVKASCRLTINNLV
jgi:hypothetical protein